MRSLLAPFLCCLALFASVRDTSAADDHAAFAGIWTGEIVAPNTRTELGLAFTATEKGFLVSLHFPAMFLSSVNFGPADIHGDTFTLAPLNLTLTRHGDTLTGTFALSRLPVELHRGGAFSPAPAPTAFPDAPAPAWTLALGAPAWASVAALDGVVYVATTAGALHAVRAADGHLLWKWSGPHPLYGDALPTADAVYLLDEHGDLVALDRSAGTLRWRTPLHDEKLAGGPRPQNETFNHRAPAPIIDEKGILYAGSTDRGVYAVRARTGKIIWRFETKTKIYAPLTLRGDDLLVAGFDGSVVTVNRRTHRETARVTLGGPLVSAPVVAGDRLVVGARDYLLYGLDAKTRTVAWRNSFWFSWVESTPRLIDGTLYIGGSDFRRISALEPSTGRTLWATDVRGLSWGSPVVTADTVFAGTAGQNIEGTVIQHTGGLVALDRRSGAPRWRYLAPVPAGADFTGFAGSLVVADGKIIGATVDGTLIALPAGTP